MRLKKIDWIYIIGLIIIVISPLIIGQYAWGKENYTFMVTFSGFIPIFITHTFPIGLRFRNLYFVILWLIMIGLHGTLYHETAPIWISMISSFILINLLQLVFKKINKEFPITLIIHTGGFILDYNKIEKRYENKRDVIFTLISYFICLPVSIWILIKTQ